MRKRLPLKISISGVRGVTGDSLTPQLSASFAQAFGSYLGRGKVIVGQDTRASGTMIKNAIFSGLLSVGCQPVNIDICPIPSILIFTKEKKAVGGIAVTASHNPKDWNGLKFINAKGLFLNHPQIEEFLDIYHQGDFSLVTVDHYRSLVSEKNPTNIHLNKLLNYLDVDLIRRKKFKVVADCCNGAGTVLMPQFLKNLGCQMTLINTTLDGAFAHHPEPLPENLNRLINMVKEKKADIGFVQDADADRLSIINEKGEPIGEELSLALAVKYILNKKPGAVVTNLSTTQAIDDISGEINVPVFRTKIGEINVVEEIINKKAVIGGEGNGGVILPEIHPCRDSFTAMGLILEYMASSGKSVSQLRQGIPKYYMIKDKIDATSDQAHHIIRELKKQYSGKEQISTLDGLKINFSQAWIHIRPSNTEPIIRLVAEAKNRKMVENLVESFKKEILEVMEWK
ncbi:MAG: phosphoglucosamine mutase [Candidatus Aminicenantaceae bacterium]